MHAVVGIAAVVAVAVVLWQPGNGFDLTDEASYVQAADPRVRAAAFNGFFGLYLRGLWILCHWNVAVVRVVGVLVMAAAAALLGVAAARLARRPAVPVAGLTVAAGMGYYGQSLRTPSYNWLAVLGAALVCAALLRLLDHGPSWWGAVAGLGVAVAITGKITTGVVLTAAVAVIALRRQPRALGWAGAALLAAAFIHVTLVLSPAESLGLLRRAAELLAVFDAAHYTPLTSIDALVAQLPQVLAIPLVVGALGLLPVLAPPGPRQETWFRTVTVVAVVAAVVALLLDNGWSGGYRRAHVGASGLLALLILVGCAALCGAVLRLDGRGTRQTAAGVGVLVVGVAAAAEGSLVSLGWITGTYGSLFLAPACVLACDALPVRSVDGVAAAVLLAVAAGSVVVALEARDDPKRSAPLALSTVPVRLGPVVARVDPRTAAELSRLRIKADDAGWRPETPLLDATFAPGVPLLLHARVPAVLLPFFPGRNPSMVCVAVRGDEAVWRRAWVLVDRNAPPAELAGIARCLGRTWPQDYVTVTPFGTPWTNVPAVLLRPRG